MNLAQLFPTPFSYSQRNEAKRLKREMERIVRFGPGPHTRGFEVFDSSYPPVYESQPVVNARTTRCAYCGRARDLLDLASCVGCGAGP